MTKYNFLIGKKIQWVLQPEGHPPVNTKEGIVKEIKQINKWGDNIPYWIATLERDNGTTFKVALEDTDVKIKMISKK